MARSISLPGRWEGSRRREGGFTSARKAIVELLRQRSRPHLFSNSVAPSVVAASMKALEVLSASTELRQVEANTLYFRADLTECGPTIKRGCIQSS